MAVYKSIAANWEMFGINVAYRDDLPNATSYLFGAWTRAEPPEDPNAFLGNNNILEIGGASFFQRNITDSIYHEGHRPLNHNIQLVGKRESPASQPWMGDVCSYYSPPDADITLAEKFGWKYTVWQYINDVENQRMIFRQWIKIPGKPLFKTACTDSFQNASYDSIVTYAQARELLVINSYGEWTTEQAAAWTPGDITYFRLGSTGGGGSDTYIVNARLFLGVTAEPSLQDLEAMAVNFSADLTAWGDYKLEYPSLADRSGNNRTLSVMGSIHEGILFAEPGIMASTNTLTGPVEGETGQASTNFTITIDGETFEDITFTPSDATTPNGGGGGTFTPESVVIPAGINGSVTFTYTPASNGPKIVSITNNGALVNLTTVSYEASTSIVYATTYTVAGPSAGETGDPSTDFTITIDGETAQEITFIPSDGGAGGTFTPASVAIPAGTDGTGTFTYTPASDGEKTITITNNGGLSDPEPVSYTAATTPVPGGSGEYCFGYIGA